MCTHTLCDCMFSPGSHGARIPHSMCVHPCVASLLLQERAIKEAIKLIREQQTGTNVDQVQASTSASADSEQDKQTVQTRSYIK